MIVLHLFEHRVPKPEFLALKDDLNKTKKLLDLVISEVTKLGGKVKK